MFNDESERLLLQQDPYEQSLQSWARMIEEDRRQKNGLSLRARTFAAVGKGFIAIGSWLTNRFGGTMEQPRNRVFN